MEQALINNAPGVVSALLNIEKLGVIGILVIIVIIQYFNQKNFYQAIKGLEDIIKVLKQDTDNREDKNDEVRREIRTELKEMNKELNEIKAILKSNSYNSRSSWKEDR